MCSLTELNVLTKFHLDADNSEDSSPPLPERTPESFVLASEPSEFFMLCDNCGESVEFLPVLCFWLVLRC